MKQNAPKSLIKNVSDLILPKIKPSCGPVFFARSLEVAAGNIAANGSFGLVDTGKKKFLVTCYHVLEEFRKLQCETPGLMFCVALGGFPETLTVDNVIDEDKNLDIATFDIEFLMPLAQGRQYFPLNCGHVHKVEKDVILLVVGYPKRNRFETDKNILWGTSPHLFLAADVTDYTIMAKTDGIRNMDWQLLSERHENPYGGISGSLCFAIKKNWLVEPIAIVIQHLDELKMMQFRLLRCLNPDGTLNRY